MKVSNVKMMSILFSKLVLNRIENELRFDDVTKKKKSEATVKKFQ